MRTQAIKKQAVNNSKVSARKKLAIAGSLAAVILVIVLTYKKLQPKVLKYFKKRKSRYRTVKKRIVNREIDYSKYIEMMAEAQENYEAKASIWI